MIIYEVLDYSEMACKTYKILILFLLLGQVFVGCQLQNDHNKIGKVGAIVYMVKDIVELQYKVDTLVRAGIDMPKKAGHSLMMIFSKPSSVSLQQYKCAFTEIHATRELKRITGLDIQTLLKMNKWRTAWDSLVLEPCSSRRNISCNGTCGIYRTFDGSCNNEHYPTWGMASRAQRRYLPPVYSDGANSPRTAGVESWGLPSALSISDSVFKAKSTTTQDGRLTVLHVAFGQFIANDVIYTPVIADEKGGMMECCDSVYKRSDCIPIGKTYSDSKHQCMSLVRSLPGVDDTCFDGFRGQINAATSYLDASNVYGSSEEKANSLRQLHGGLLKVGVGNGLPEGDTKCYKDVPSDYCQDAGNDRVNVVPMLSAVQLLFVREHNRIARRLQHINPKWDDETLFQETRRIVIALIQNIVYSEYLPLVVGKKHMDYHHLAIDGNHNGGHNMYNDQLDPTITNVFGAAAFRFGHSMIPSTQEQFNKNHEIVNITDLEKTFYRPHFVEQNMGAGYDGVIRWMKQGLAKEADREFESGVRERLFPMKDGRAYDLPAVNIKRGRDHGIPSYNKWREWCGLTNVKSFHCKTSGLVDHDPDAIRALANAYKSIDDIDLYAGAITERHLEGATVGPTFACIISKQFSDLKSGDRFWFENSKTDHSFEYDQILQIKNITLANIICKNFDVDEIQEYAFKPDSGQGGGNKYLPCNSFMDLDMSPWKSEN